MLGFKLLGSGLNGLSVSAICDDVGTSITATGTSISDATALTNALNYVSTVATSAGVRLYAGSSGDWQVVYNGGANPVRVYPPVSGKINVIATNGAHILPTNTACIYFFMSSTQVVGVLSA